MKKFFNDLKTILKSENLLSITINEIVKPKLKSFKNKIYTFLNTVFPKNLIISEGLKVKKVTTFPTLKDIITKAYIKNYEHQSSKPKSSDLIK
jgi:hypothetical protein